MHADHRALITREELALLRQKLRENPETEEGIMTAMDILPVLRSWWEEERGPGVPRELLSGLDIAWGYHGGGLTGRRGRQRTRRGRLAFWKISCSYCEQCRGRT
jgi:hypothetical protein